MSHHEVDVLVVGAGPSGTAAAYDLVSRGYKVLIVDRQSFPRHKACGGALSKRAIDRFRYPVNEVVKSEISRVTITRKANAGKDIHAPVPVGCLTTRYELDHFMLNKALEQGALFSKVERRPLHITEGRESVDVAWQDLSVAAKWVIAADGANSQIRALVYGKQIQQRCMAIEGDAEIQGSLQGMGARIDFGYATHGYGWFFPKGSQVNVGLYTSESWHEELGQQQLKDYARKIYGIENLKNIKAAPVGTHGYRLPLVTRRVFFVGDAAGFSDTLYGEGLFGALMTGQEAAESILAHSEKRPAWKTFRKKMGFWRRRLRYIRFLSFCFYHTLPLIYPVFQRHCHKELNKKENLMTRP